jgi:hypothetical protein
VDPVEEIKQLYFNATRSTIQRDIARAVQLIKTLPDEAARERVAVYMDGLSQMRSEWAAAGGPQGPPRGQKPRKPGPKPPRGR